MENAEELTLPLHLLPDDVLAGVLARLSPRGVATSRCVCKAWRAVVDAHRLLRTELLPFSVGGIFLVPWAIGFPPLFAPPSPTMSHADDDDLGYLEGARDVSSWQIEGHCSGLLLQPCHAAIWSRLPPPPVSSLPLGMKDLCHNPYLMFDPITSPHYEVVLVPELPYWEELDPATEELEWPPSPCAMRIFSSRTGHWEERPFIRDGPALETIAGMRNFPHNFGYHNGVYWQGALYVQCHRNNFVMRINSSTERYHMAGRNGC
nr:unnamed protein product [Digitaria exilis]